MTDNNITKNIHNNCNNDDNSIVNDNNMKHSNAKIETNVNTTASSEYSDETYINSNKNINIETTQQSPEPQSDSEHDDHEHGSHGHGGHEHGCLDHGDHEPSGHEHGGHGHGHNHSGHERLAGNKQIELMSTAPVSRAILKMSLPVVLGMMVSVVYNLVDTLFIGMLKDELQLAAASISTPIFMLLMALATIVSTGAASYISRSIGKKDVEEADRTLNTGILICVLLAIVIMTAGIIWIKPLVIGMGASEDVYPYAYQYILVMLIGAIPVMLNYAGGQLLRSEGAAMPAMFGMMIGTVANIVLDPLFIFVFKMGILGAAIATVLGNACALIYYIIYYTSGKSMLKVHPKYISGKSLIWKEIFFIGIPACLSQLLAGVAMIILNNRAANYGDTVLAGMGISSKLLYIGTFIFMGFAAGCQPLVGYNYGAKNYDRVKKIFKTGMLMTFAIGVGLWLIFFFGARIAVSCFTPIEAVIEEGAAVFKISIFAFLVLGPQMLATTGIQAFGKAGLSLILSITRQGIFYVPLMFIMEKELGFAGLIWAQPIADALTLIIGLIFLGTTLRKCISKTDQ